MPRKTPAPTASLMASATMAAIPFEMDGLEGRVTPPEEWTRLSQALNDYSCGGPRVMKVGVTVNVLLYHRIPFLSSFMISTPAAAADDLDWTNRKKKTLTLTQQVYLNQSVVKKALNVPDAAVFFQCDDSTGFNYTGFTSSPAYQPANIMPLALHPLLYSSGVSWFLEVLRVS